MQAVQVARPPHRAVWFRGCIEVDIDGTPMPDNVVVVGGQMSARVDFGGLKGGWASQRSALLFQMHLMPTLLRRQSSRVLKTPHSPGTNAKRSPLSTPLKPP